ncbi:hypothetical protein AAF712_013220 [Marasmius tenuissimus]|uniref:ABC transporter domain-containing protein n=1 Tax=Marasmius tenuissimus TaxID=585030 RepID=A0ABR2ZGA5_9AGAR
MNEKISQTTSDNVDDTLDVTQAGVYRVYTEKKKFRLFEINHGRLFDARDKWLRSYRVILRLFREIAPGLILLWMFLKAWEGAQNVLLGTLESRVLRIIEHGISTHSLDTSALIMTIVARLTCVLLSVVVTDPWSQWAYRAVSSRVKEYFDVMIFTAKLQMDLPTVQDNTTFDHLDAETGFHAIESILAILSAVISGVGHLVLMGSVARGSSGNYGVFFAALSVLRPALTYMDYAGIISTQANNPHYLRVLAFKDLVDTKYRLDIISGNITQYVSEQYKAAKSRLGDVKTEHPEWQVFDLSRDSILTLDGLRTILVHLLGEVPMVYFVVTAILDPSKMSLATLATVQASSNSLQGTYFRVMFYVARLAENTAQVQQIFDIQLVTKVVKDEGHLSYPTEVNTTNGGMSFELCNVVFKYPGGKTTSNALDGVSFKIGAGELVVVVGANGSGKSTFVNILSRLYDPTSGQVLVDGVDIKAYKMSDIRQAVAILTQDHQLYPLSLRENIGLGSVEDLSNDEMIKLRQLKKTSNVSGGERQRLVASRTFMRFNSNRVKFVAADEPTAALDPEGELELFTRLREAREGKTMVFITHRFGPLVKHADRIICMKEGKIVESGDHGTLMGLKGEYHKMYSIQARAFEA